jgi:hypothetical protein
MVKKLALAFGSSKWPAFGRRHDQISAQNWSLTDLQFLDNSISGGWGRGNGAWWQPEGAVWQEILI